MCVKVESIIEKRYDSLTAARLNVIQNFKRATHQCCMYSVKAVRKQSRTHPLCFRYTKLSTLLHLKFHSPALVKHVLNASAPH